MNSCRLWTLSAVRWLLLSLIVSAAPLTRAQFTVENVELRADGRIELRFPSDAASYYRLLSGPEVTAIITPVSLGLASPLVAPPDNAPMRFYRVQQVPRALPIDSDADQIPDIYELLHEFLNPLNAGDAAADPDGNGLTALQEYQNSLDDGKLVTISSTFPIAGEAGVSVNRETVVHFSAPIAADAVITSANFFAGFAGRKFLSRVELSSDRRKASLFYLEPIPGSTRITAVFDATGIKDRNGREIDADNDGQPGGMHLLQFDTYSTAAILGTAISGVIYASEPVPDGNGGFSNKPIPGVTVTVDGAEETLRATTGADGRFTLNNCPAGRFFVHVDGRTSPLSDWPSGAYYPNIGKAWTAVGGRADNVTPGDGTIFLPLIPAETLKAVSVTQDTEIRLSPDAVAANPELAGVKILVPANSLFDNDGKRGGMVGIAMVDPTRLPEPLPAGLSHILDITVQSDGGQNFDRPVPACFPNVPNKAGFPMAPGSRAVLMSFNHDTGKWETVGGMTVSDDGKTVCTDPGVGIRQPGWHGMEGPPPINPPPAPPTGFGPLTATGPANPPPPGGDCKTTTNAQCDSRCKDIGLAEEAQCNADFQAKTDACFAAGNLHGSCESSVLAAERDGCLAAAREKRRKCADGCVTQTCGGGGGGPTPAKVSQIAHEDSPADQAAALLDQIRDRLAMIGAAGREPTQAELDDLRAVMAQIKAITGANGSAFWNAVISPAQARAAQNDLFSWGAPSYPIYRAAFSIRTRVLVDQREDLAWQNTFIRDSIEPYGQYQVFLPISALRGQDGREGQDHVRIENWFYDPRTHSVARSSVPKVRADFMPRFLPSFTLVPVVPRLLERTPLLPEFIDFQLSFINSLAEVFGSDFLANGINSAIDRLDGRDTDNDGLADIAEFIVGTDMRKADTDGDGIQDGAELDQGLNPLDGRPTAVGIIGSVPSQGEAIDIATFNDRAIVALNAGGIGIFDIAAERLGVLIARLDAPGEVKTVALSQDFGVAGGVFEGLLVIDPRAPTTPRRIPISGQVTAVAVEGGLALVATSSAELHLVDLGTANILDTVRIPAPALDIALDGGLASVVLNQDLIVFELTGSALAQRGQVALGLGQTEILTARRRVATGDGRALVTEASGFGRFDVSNPSSPSKISTAQPYGPFSFKQIVPTGSGLGLAVVGAGPVSDPSTHNVQLFNLRDPLVNNNAGLIIRTPGLARAASIYNGLAYVADGFAGMQIVNFLASDTGAIPPTITLLTSGIEGRTEEGHLLRLSARVTDDVQVRVVEFYRDGEKIGSDGNFPFEIALVAPSLTAIKTNVIVRARAFDTGGNATWSEEITLQLVPDATAPRLVSVTPRDGGLLDKAGTFLALFSEGIDPLTVTEAAIQLRSAGPDGILGNGDDVLIADYSLEQRDTPPSVAIRASTTLAPNAYRLIFSPLLKDRAGNPLQTIVNSDFRIFDPTKDNDGDGLPDDVEITLGLNPTKADSNANGIPDGREDADGDSLSNAYELTYNLDPLRRDSDNNGILDGDEDRDRDGLTEKREQSAGTNPLLADTDADGWSDEAELAAGSNPRLASSTPFLQITARPQVEVVAPRIDLGTGFTFGTTVAHPAVEVVAPRLILDGVSFGTTVARPQVEIVAPRLILDGVSFGTTVAKPSVEVVAPRLILDGVSFGTTVAKPSVEVVAPRISFEDLTFGTTVAFPKATIEFNQ